MTTTKMAAQVTMHSESYGDGGHHPAVNVKVYGTDWPSAEQLAAQSGCSLKQAEQALEMAWDAAVEDFWVAAEAAVKEIFGPSASVYCEGRSGGWCSVYGLPEDVANWPAKLRRQWHAFESSLREEIKYRTSEAWALEIITLNNWLTPRPTDAEIITELSTALEAVVVQLAAYADHGWLGAGWRERIGLREDLNKGRAALAKVTAP